ncbi:MAG TPA: hypothetical protein VFV86_09380 [Nitrososphaeraceae archaeon]|nr:hypothetical protein [Nitrososphaeraceae archaeon]
MKSIVIFKKLTMLTIAIFITATLIIFIFAIMSTDTFAQRDMRESVSFDGGDEPSKGHASDTPWACASKNILDSPEGKALGWNPDGKRTAFTIKEPCYLEEDSTVLVNVKDGGSNFQVCNVDFSTDGFFEVYCNAPPADGSELRYLVLVQWLDVIGSEPMSMEEIPQDLAERQQQTNTTVTGQ